MSHIRVNSVSLGTGTRASSTPKRTSKLDSESGGAWRAQLVVLGLKRSKGNPRAFGPFFLRLSPGQGRCEVQRGGHSSEALCCSDERENLRKKHSESLPQSLFFSSARRLPRLRLRHCDLVGSAWCHEVRGPLAWPGTRLLALLGKICTLAHQFGSSLQAEVMKLSQQNPVKKHPDCASPTSLAQSTAPKTVS